MSNLENELQIIVKGLFGPGFSYVSFSDEVWRPFADVYVTEKYMVVKIELAGIDPKEVQVLLDGTDMVIQGVRKEQVKNEIIYYQQMEINYNSFRRVIQLPFQAKTENVKTKYEDGILEIILSPLSKQITKQARK